LFPDCSISSGDILPTDALMASTAVRESGACFSEHLYKPGEGLASQYQAAVRRGRARMAETRIVFCGLARNVANILPLTRLRLERTGAMFADYRIFLYENDSADDTAAQLAAWAAVNSRVQLVSERRGRRQHASVRCLARAADMAEYRNRCQQHVRELWTDFEYVCVVDTDLLNGWSYDGLAHSFGSEPWDSVGAYGVIHRRRHFSLRALHYDVWAYRAFGDFAPLEGKVGNALSWRRGQPLVPVYSCFGGIGLYRMPAWLSACYSGEDCEHVTLHRAMRAAGYDRQFLNPSQIALYGHKARTFDRLLLPLGQVVQAAACLFAF
jgi:hypothetical protein